MLGFLLFRVQRVHHDVRVGVGDDGFVGVVNDHAGLASGNFLHLPHLGHVHGDILTIAGFGIVGGQLGSLGEGVVRRCFAAAGNDDVAAMHLAAQQYPGAVLAVGNAPTALLAIAEEIETGLRPALVIGVPVGFVNVVESKERLLAVCERYGVPAIVAMGRKGGSTVAAAICNALLYQAAEMLDPKARGWQ